MPLVVRLDKRAHIDELGFIPSFIDEHDPRSAKEQFDVNYQFGGGWHSLPGFTLENCRTLHYPGDPPMNPLFMMFLRNEMILIYPYGFVAIVQPGGVEFEAARLD